jgi:hypothetical protein
MEGEVASYLDRADRLLSETAPGEVPGSGSREHALGSGERVPDHAAADADAVQVASTKGARG